MLTTISFERCAEHSMPPSRLLWQLKNKSNCLLSVEVITDDSASIPPNHRPIPACLNFPLFQARRFICVCTNNMALKQRRIFLGVINYIVVRAREEFADCAAGNGCWLSRAISVWQRRRMRRKRYRNYVVKGNIKLSKNIFPATPSSGCTLVRVL